MAREWQAIADFSLLASVHMARIYCFKCGHVLDAESVHDVDLLSICPRCGSDQVAVDRVEKEPFLQTEKPESGALAETIGVNENFDGAFSVPRDFGHYEILTRIAQGGMGVVYRARDTKLKRTVALKMILGGALPNEDDVRRFHSEAKAAARLDHPNIVPIYEAGQIQGRHFFAMRYVEGSSLAAEIANGPMPPRRAAELTRDISLAVEHAHQQGIIHRDLKPGNVLTDMQGRVQVTDFGLAKWMEHDESLTASGQVLGTPSFMPPEQALGRANSATAESDVYSIGAILYNLLTGRPPFQAATSVETLGEVINQDPVAPRRLNSHIPRDLETICLSCLQKDPQKRYASAKDLSDDIDAFLAGEPIQARPDSFVNKTLRWAKRNKTISTLGASVCLLVLSVAIAASIGYTYMRSLYEQTAWALSDSEFQSKKAKAAADLATEKARIAEEQREVARKALSKYREEVDEREKAQARELEALKQASEARARIKEEQNKTAEATQLATQAQAERQEALSLSTKTSYQHLLGQAERRLRDGDRMAAMELLKACPESMRSWEWQFLVGYCSSGSGNIRFSGATHWEVFKQSSAVNEIATSPFGSLIGIACEDGSVRIVDPIQGKVVFERRICENPLRVIRFSPKNQYVAAAGDDERIFVIDLTLKKPLTSLRGCPDGNTALAFAPHGLAVGGRDGTIRLWPGIERNSIEFATQHGGAIESIDFLFLPRTRHVVNGAVVIASLGKGGRIMLSHLNGRPAEVEWPPSIANRGIKFVKLGLGVNGGLYIGGETSAELSHLSVALSPRFVKRTVYEKQKVTTTDKNGKPVTSTKQVPKVVNVYLKSVVQLMPGRPLKLGAARSKKTATTMSRFSVGSTTGHLAIASDSKIRTFDPRTGKLLNAFHGHRSQVTGLTWSRDGQYIVSADKNGYVYYRHRNANLDGHAGDIRQIAYSPTNDLFASAGADNLAKVWEKPNGRLLGDLKHTSDVQSLCFAADGESLFTGTEAGTIIQWAIAQQPMNKLATHAIHKGGVNCLVVGVESSVISGGKDGRVVQLRDGKILSEMQMKSEVVCLASSGATIAVGTEDGAYIWIPLDDKTRRLGSSSVKRVSSISLSGDAQQVAVGSETGTVTLWEVKTGTMRFESQLAAVTDVKFSVDGRRLFVGSTGGTLSIIDTENGAVLLRLPSTNAIRRLAINRRGNMLTMAGNGGDIRTWKATIFDSDSAEVVEKAKGIVGDDFAMVFELPLNDFDPVSRRLATQGFHPIRLRPYQTSNGVRVAAIWNEGNRGWRAEYGVGKVKLAEHESRMRTAGFNIQDVASYETKDKRGQPIVQHAAIWLERGPNTPANQLLLGVDRGRMIRQQKYFTARDIAPQAVDVFVSKSRKLTFNGVFRKSAVVWQVFPVQWTQESESTDNKLEPSDVRIVVRDNTPIIHQLAIEMLHVDSKLIRSTSMDQHLRQSRDLIRQGFRPVSLAVQNESDKQFVGSIWHRPSVER